MIGCDIMNIIKSLIREGYRIDIVIDPFPCDPREFDNLGYLVCWHNRYQLGDEMPRINMQDWYNEHCTEYEIMLPVYLMDHSGLALSIKPFNDPWDSGQVGWLCVTKEQLEAEYGLHYDPDDVRAVLYAEIATYSAYLNGECYGWRITMDDGELVDDGYGFYDMDQCIREAEAIVDEMTR